MPLTIEGHHLGEVMVIVPEVFEDDRGFFMEAYRADRFRELGLPHNFVQENHSYSKKGVLRGLHFQWDPPMGKLMRVTRGAAFLVAVDVRLGSPTVGKWVGIEATAQNRKQVWAPAGFGRGFLALPKMSKFNTTAQESITPKQSQLFAGTIPRLGLNGRYNPGSFRKKTVKRRHLGSGWLHLTRNVSHIVLKP